VALYRIDNGRVVSHARSSIHDTRTVWSRLTGTIEADPDALASAGARAEIAVDMRAFDAGDFLKNRKLRKDLAVDAHPAAKFTLRELREVARRPDGRFDATAVGVIAWRGREATVDARGTGALDAQRLDATATFDLDVTRLGVTPPRILLFKVADVVTIEVAISGRALG
jgi:hypothetical protein